MPGFDNLFNRTPIFGGVRVLDRLVPQPQFAVPTGGLLDGHTRGFASAEEAADYADANRTIFGPAPVIKNW